MSKRKIPLQGKGRQFRADLWMDEKITGRTLDALRRQGVRFPEGKQSRKSIPETGCHGTASYVRYPQERGHSKQRPRPLCERYPVAV